MPARCSGAKVKARMKALSMTTSKLIRVSGVSESTLRRIFSDKSYTTSDHTLQCLADALQCSPFDLLRDEAITDMVKDASEQAVVDVVTEAVVEAVTVIAEGMAPDASSDEIASTIPPLPVTTPPVLDVPNYFDYIRESTDALVKALTKSRDTWKTTSIVLFCILIFAVVYFLWEIFNPDKGLTSILWKIYASTPTPSYVPTPTISLDPFL